MRADLAATKKAIRTHARRWQRLLQLPDVTHIWVDQPYDADNDGERTHADTRCLWQYKSAVVRWYLPTMALLDADAVEATVVHELVHVMVNPMESHVPDRFVEQREFAVETVTRALLNVTKGR